MRHRSRLSDATWTAFTECIRFIVVPIVLVDLVMNNYPQLTHAFMPDIKTYMMFFGGMIAASSTLEAINKPGTFKRLLFGWSALGFVCMWLFVIFGGGVTQFTYGAYTVQFDISKIVYIMLVGVSLKGLLVLSTYRTHKRMLEDEAKQKKLEALREKTSRRRPSARRRTASPVFESFSKMAYEVTPDDAIGYVPPPPPPPMQAKHQQRTLAHKICPVCGAETAPHEPSCRNCGAWFSKETVR